MAWWYRDPVSRIAQNHAAWVGALPDIVVEGYQFLSDRGHALIGFNDIGLDTPCWIPEHCAFGGQCFEFTPHGTGGKFSPGKFTMSVWLHRRREHLIARHLLANRPAPPPRIVRPKVFNPKAKPPPDAVLPPKGGQLSRRQSGRARSVEGAPTTPHPKPEAVDRQLKFRL